MGATGGLLWVGTESGRLIRHDTVNSTTEEVRGRLGVGKLDVAVLRIYANPFTHGALIILRNADGYLAHGKGLVRPRWLAKLRGLRCSSAAWLRVPHPSGEKNIALLGTAFGALFSLTVDHKHEKDDTLTLLWNAPNSEKVDGVRVEQVAGKYIAMVATTTTLYLFSDALTLTDLFVEERLTVVNRVVPATSSNNGPGTSSSMSMNEGEDFPLPSELHFMTGGSGVASRRFVWAGSSGVTHAQLSVRRRRTDSSSKTEHTSRADREPRSAVVAAVIDRETISWASLKDASGSAVPLACNLSAFHVLILYPNSIYAFNHISGNLTQHIALWKPSGVVSSSSSGPLSLGSPRGLLGDVDSSRGSRDERNGQKHCLSSPACGLIRDVSADAVWIYSSDGEFACLTATSEEQTEAWKAAKSVGRFDLAMALAPFVSSGTHDNSAMYQTRDTILEAQADHAASEGNWDVAARLYAKTNTPVESVVLRIVESCSKDKGAFAARKSVESNLSALGIGVRLKTVRYIITYLVNKLDRVDSVKPMQRTIVATLLVQLYSLQLSSETNVERLDEVRKDFGNFLADRHQDLEIGTSLEILLGNGCFDEAWNLAVLSGEVLSACEISCSRGQVERSLSLLKNSNVINDSDIQSQLITRLANSIAPHTPKRFMTAVARSLGKQSHYTDHLAVIQGLARVARNSKNEEKSLEAYHAATVYLFDLLHDWWGGNNGNESNDNGNIMIRDTTKQRDWFNLVTFLFVLHAEFGVEAEAQRSYDHLIAPYVSPDMHQAVSDTLGVILRCASIAGFRTLCVHLYQALGLLEMAVSSAIKVDINLAESLVGHLGSEDVSESTLRQLWCMVARGSDDPVGIVEKSRSVLHIEDVLNDMEPFESPTERVKNAVANSLEEHKRLANVAKNDAVSAIEVTSHLRQDVEKAQLWQQKAQSTRARTGYTLLSCGHRARSHTKPGVGANECEFCGEAAIDSLDAPFDKGLSLPVNFQTK